MSLVISQVALDVELENNISGYGVPEKYKTSASRKKCKYISMRSIQKGASHIPEFQKRDDVLKIAVQR